MSYPSQKVFAQQLRALQAGIDAELKKNEIIVLGQVKYTPPQLRAKIDQLLAILEKANTALDAYKVALAAAKKGRKEAEALQGQFHALVKGRHGKRNPILAKYGFVPETPRDIPVATKAISALRGKATRKERGTTSKKQKSKIKGKVDEAAIAALLGEGDAKGKKKA